MRILSPGGGTNGVYLQKVGGSVLASTNATYAYEPASSIKPVIALYAMEQVKSGLAKLTDEIPEIDNSGGPGDCPPATITGTEQLGNALTQMLEVSDNNRTRELMQYFGVSNLNSFAASIGLSSTMFQTSASPPGFNVIGCVSYGFSSTVDGNTMSLTDAAKLWTAIASLPAPYADQFYQLAAGRDMFNNVHYDFTGLWPNVTAIAAQEKPSGMTTAQFNSFVDHMNVSVKGGSYDLYQCTSGAGCEATWWVFAGMAEIPSCVGTTVTHSNYVWGYFKNDAVSAYNSNPDLTPGGVAFFNASGQLLAAPMAQSLATWKNCAPVAPVTLSVSGVNVTSSSLNVGVASILGKLVDSDKSDVAPDLVGTITWGAGPISYATISGGSGRFTVHGWHTYASPGVYNVTLHVLSETRKGTVKATLTVTVT